MNKKQRVMLSRILAAAALLILFQFLPLTGVVRFLAYLVPYLSLIHICVTVTVDHGKGMESVYSNLAESVNVQPGTEVEAGTVIGTVGTTAVSESADASHLHFSMREYGVAIDPLNYLH